jgi:hypothetical protein
LSGSHFQVQATRSTHPLSDSAKIPIRVRMMANCDYTEPDLHSEIVNTLLEVYLQEIRISRKSALAHFPISRHRSAYPIALGIGS